MLCIGGFEKSGRVGLLRDQSIAESLGASAVLVRTSNSTQINPENSRTEVSGLRVTEVDTFRDLLEDALRRSSTVDAIKIGAIGSLNQAHCLAQILSHAEMTCPIVWDPVYVSSTGFKLFTGSESELREAIRTLLPIVNVITPNADEASFIAQAESCTNLGELCANRDLCCVVTGGDSSPTDGPIHIALHTPHAKKEFNVERVEGNTRGTGCLFATSLAIHLGRGEQISDAIHKSAESVRNRILQPY